MCEHNAVTTQVGFVPQGGMAQNLSDFLSYCEKIVGDFYICYRPECLEPYTRNVSGFTRRISAVVRPSDTSQVQAIVNVANRCGVPLYPISTGKNWGFGSRLPVIDDCVVVNLGRMNRIREVNTKYGYAIIEPGVTQGQLYDYLETHQVPFFVDITGSGKDTSIIGCMLERGIAYNSLRVEDLLSLEVALGNGEILKTGFGHFPHALLANLFKYGIGPSLEGLFIQSNYGIVTSATIKLNPIPEAQSTFLINISEEEKLGPAVDVLHNLMVTGLIRCVVHIGNRNRAEIVAAPLIAEYYRAKGKTVDRQTIVDFLSKELSGPWSAIGNIMGPKSHVRAVERRIRGLFKGFARVLFLNRSKLVIAERVTEILNFIPFFERKRAFLAAFEPLFGLTQGIPTDAALHSVYWPISTMDNPLADPDSGRAGLLYCVPLAPMDGTAAKEMLEIVNRIFEGYGFTPYITLNTLNANVLEAVINLVFDRSSEESTRRAQICIRELHKEYISRGFLPYRVSIDLMSEIVDPNDLFWQIVRDLKSVFDPNHVIAPGRYNLI